MVLYRSDKVFLVESTQVCSFELKRLTCPLCLVQFSVRENLLVVRGASESKEIKDLLPEILKQVGPQQYGFLKDLIDQTGGKLAKGAAGKDAAAGEDDEDDVPPLVDGTFENAGK